MSTSSTKITYLDGMRLYRAIVAGIRQVISQQEFLNNINVFPVPDRDTGTNMALTLNAILEDTYSCQNNQDIHMLLDTVANAALNGARGNSGAILAQFFFGLSEGAQTVKRKMTTQNFVSAMATAVNYAHKALSNPKEGTILTILRDFSDEITSQQLKNNDIDYIDLLSLGVQRSEKSLEHTQFQLKEMKKAGVVDAGAQGFVEFLNGIYNFVLNGSIKKLEEDVAEIKIIESDETEITHDIDEKFRYCTECIVHKKHGKDINQDELRRTLDEIGNSLIIAGSSKISKIHIHTNDPNRIFDICRQHGEVAGEKADDMIHQQKSFVHRKTKVAVLTDSGAELPADVIAKLNIHVVPIVVNFGSETYIDKVSMTTEEFFEESARNPIHPTSSQPSFGDFHRQYQYLSTHFDNILSVHLPQKLSGTMDASLKASEKIKNKNQISVVDSLTVSGGEGLVAMYAAEASQAGYPLNDIVNMTNTIIEKTGFFVAVPKLQNLVNGGRLPVRVKRVLDLFRFTPVLTFGKPGKVKLDSILLGKKRIPEKLFRLLKKKIDPNKIYRLIIVYTTRIDESKQLEKLVNHYFSNIETMFVVPCGASLAVHAGRDSLGVGIQEYTAIKPYDAKAEETTFEKELLHKSKTNHVIPEIA